MADTVSYRFSDQMFQIIDLLFITPEGGCWTLANFYLWMVFHLCSKLWQKSIGTPIDGVRNVCMPLDLPQMEVKEPFVLFLE
jgi:hypothetical protein